MRDDSAAPAPSAGARRLIDRFEMAALAEFKGAGSAGRYEAERLLSAYVAGLEAEVARLLTIYGSRFPLGARVRKTKSSSWHGRVVGFYSTGLTPIGYAVESEREPGSVQIYPETALEAWDGGR